MSWEISSFNQKRWYHSPLPWVAMAVAVAGLVFAGQHAHEFYQKWSKQRRLNKAVAAMERKDFDRAILGAKIVLARDPKNIEATKIIAKSLEALGSPQALQARRLLDTIGGSDAENYLMMAENSWKVGDPVAVARALAGVPPGAQQTAQYQKLSALVAEVRRDFEKAAVHWSEAVRLDAGNADYRLACAAVKLRVQKTDVRDAGLAELAALTAQPETRLRALRIELADLERGRDRAKAIATAEQMCAEPDATFSDQIRHLTLLQTSRRQAFEALLATLQVESLAKPDDLCQLLIWMNEHGLALAVPEWAAKLPAEMTALPPVRASLAESDALASNWKRLVSRLEGDQWDDLEPLRLAYLTRAYERMGNENAAAAAWANAVKQAQGLPGMVERLGKVVLRWGWNRKAEELLWKLATARDCPRWVTSFLWSSAFNARNTGRLFDASKLLLKADPRDPAARNVFVKLALLTGHSQDSPEKLAFTYYQQEPEDAQIATTYAVSLFYQGQSDAAVEAMKKLKPEQLGEPGVSFYYGLFLAAAGHAAEARARLQEVRPEMLLPEERALFDRALAGDESLRTPRLPSVKTDPTAFLTQ